MNPRKRQPTSAAACASILKVIADRTRLAVVRQLLEGEKHFAVLNQTLRLEQSLLSHHLKTLREAGLVVARRDGKARLYSLAPQIERRGSAKAVDLGCCALLFE